MNRLTRLALVVLLVPGMVEMVRAATIASGQFIQQTDTAKIKGTATAVGSGASDAGTQRVILASDSPAGNVTNAGTFAVQADVTKMGGVTVAKGAGASDTGTQRVILASDSPGGAVTATLAAETTKVIGTVNIAAGQTTAVTNTGTFAVQAAATLAAETTKVIGTVNPGNTANTTAWLVTSPAASAPTIAKVGATTTSAQLIAANSTRKGIEVDCDCANTDSVAINFGASAAVYASHKIMSPCSSFAPPPGVVVTSAIQIIANSGTQNCRVIEYP